MLSVGCECGCVCEAGFVLQESAYESGGCDMKCRHER